MSSDLCVIGAGCGRTGTASLKAALEQLLDAPCYHMFEVFKHSHFQHWINASAGKPDWDTVFSGYKATVDFPASVFYEELLVKYPNAKVVLSVRSSETWYNSVFETIWSPLGGEFHWAYWMIPRGRLFQRMCKGWRARILGNPEVPLTDKQAVISAFEQWNAKVKATVPPERLLVFEAKDGWGPLCKFLGVPEPSTPYPNVNDTAEFKQKMMTHRKNALVANGLLFAAVSGSIVMISKKTCKHFGGLLSIVALGCVGVLFPKRFRGA